MTSRQRAQSQAQTKSHHFQCAGGVVQSEEECVLLSLTNGVVFKWELQTVAKAAGCTGRSHEFGEASLVTRT